MNPEIFSSLKPKFKGDIDYSPQTLKTYSHDASLFEVLPQVVVYPKDSEDVKTLVNWVNEKNENGNFENKFSITARSAGTDMSGGAINTSIIADFTRYMNAFKGIKNDVAVVEPGCFYRDFDKKTMEEGKIMPAYTASREICAVGGMVGNNSGGEKTIKYGKVESYIEHLNIVLSDGNEYTVRPLSKLELHDKCLENSFEGKIYRDIRDLIEKNKTEINHAKPNVSKNSAGYYLWNVWDTKKDSGEEKFDLCKIIVGSQGTLGIVTEIGFKLVPAPTNSGVLAVFMPSIEKLPEIVNTVMPFGPDSFETYDDYSMKMAIKFSFDFIQTLGLYRTARLGIQFIPDMWLVLTGGIPKLTLLIEYSGASKEEVFKKLSETKKAIDVFGFKSRIAKNSAEAEKYWDVRRESFNLLRKHVHGRRTAPFVDDIIVRPENLPQFMPKLTAILDKYKLIYTIAGHAGDGNFHIIPLMDLDSPFSADSILEISHLVYALVNEYKGSITAEHNDGIIRTPYLLNMYGAHIVELFKQTKEIFDPNYIFNPGKKVGGTFEDIKKYIMKKN